MFLAQDWNGAVLDEVIGPADAHHWRVDHLCVQVFHDRAAKTIVQHVILNGAHDFDSTSEKLERAGVDRLDPPWIDERNGNSFLLKFARCLLRYFEHVAQAKNCYIAPV